MPDNLEIIRLNKDEEFEYFVNYKKTFHKWSLEEHSIFTKATLEYDILKIDQLNEILKVINQYNQNIGSKQRTQEELNIHIKVYQNYLNKQQTLRTPLSGNLALNTSGGSSQSSTNNNLNTGINTGNPITNNSLSLLNNVHSVNSSIMNNDMFLNNMITNNYFSIINSLDNTTGSNPTSIKDVSSNNPLLQKNQPIKLASRAISPQQSPILTSKPITTAVSLPPLPTNRSNDNNEINNSNFAPELNKKDLKILKEPWTAEDQKKFEVALVKYPSSRFSSVSRWQMVGKEVGITPKAAALRYNQMLSQLMPKKPLGLSNSSLPITIASTITTTSTTPEKDSSLGKRTRRTSGSKESPLKKEKTSHETEGSIIQSPQDTNILNSNEIEDLLSKNDSLLEQMKANIMKNENPSIPNLNEIIDNINNSIKMTEKWKSTNSMPPLPLKVNDMIVKMLSPKTNLTHQPTNNPFNLLNKANITPTTNLSKRGLSKNAEEWNLVYDEE
ncbi:hypothetical protein DICPUDRAFT_97062 [Dictyostelium purpureum]|uniref:Myb-like domain-containing protein n=1 Tax=Dictyostelium purpureum TaxID=5786 RepID=F0ZDL3_DICPU|nr:uncharacterized protein DICPUDRAFT_97062 [Dictyostelium purpureum]EGC37933.1 hypothetical protein DICPUDRAFT_97062 [Dictyostelium purpureum]|eukprot:XP_003285504.1 hypothetical protein DICPUDRAFT_97062 [Dictyostelium purpureum]